MKRIFLFVVTNLAVLALLSLVVFLIERVFGVRLGGGGYGAMLTFAAVFGFGGALISLAMSKWMAKRAMGVRVIGEPQNEAERWLLQTVARLAAAAHIRMPEVGVFDAEEMNAFATGARRDAALVAVSTGLLRAMSRPEIEAVLGHEISHVANGDMVTMTLLQGVLNTFVIFLARLIGSFVDRAVLKNERDESGIGFFLTTMVAQVVLGIFASLIVAWFSRRREYHADRGGAELAGRSNMIAALEALKQSHGAPMPDQMQAFGINSGTGGVMGLFLSHPPLDARIAALRAA
ncbi:MAG: protease HtpX [Gammaproteobacteria bacterium]|nr:protease HtpX [Gammaproteobacteria bacterium]MDE2347772.1 protease HtpX [Gammaproteobacteria bacterium]